MDPITPQGKEVKGEGGVEPLREDAHRTPSASEYRDLVNGDVIRATDEAFTGSGWRQVHCLRVGETYDMEFHIDMRRPLPEAPEAAPRPDDQREAEPSSLVEALDTLEAAFVAMGHMGANIDTQHALRPAWERARATLMKAGRV